MTKLSGLAIAMALCSALPAAAQAPDLKLKGVSLGITLEQAADILIADGYDVRVRTVTFEVAPNDPLEVALFAQKNEIGESRDAIVIRTSEHPTESRVAVINRRVIYEQRTGPIYSVYEDALLNLIGGTPTHDKSRQLPVSGNIDHILGFEWNARGGFSRPSLLDRLAPTEIPLCVHATQQSRNNVVDLNVRHDPADLYRLGSDGRYNSPRPGTFAEGCHSALSATARVAQDTQIVEEFQQTLIDHGTIEQDNRVLNIWLREKQAETQADLARDRGAPDL